MSDKLAILIDKYDRDLTTAFKRIRALEEVLEEAETAMDESFDMIIWMTGSPSFGPNGEAPSGFKKVYPRVPDKIEKTLSRIKAVRHE